MCGMPRYQASRHLVIVFVTYGLLMPFLPMLVVGSGSNPDHNSRRHMDSAIALGSARAVEQDATRYLYSSSVHVNTHWGV